MACAFNTIDDGFTTYFSLYASHIQDSAWTPPTLPCLTNYELMSKRITNWMLGTWVTFMKIDAITILTPVVYDCVELRIWNQRTISWWCSYAQEACSICLTYLTNPVLISSPPLPLTPFFFSLYSSSLTSPNFLWVVTLSTQLFLIRYVCHDAPGIERSQG